MVEKGDVQSADEPEKDGQACDAFKFGHCSRFSKDASGGLSVLRR
jgi:hypothetical protein